VAPASSAAAWQALPGGAIPASAVVAGGAAALPAWMRRFVPADDVATEDDAADSAAGAAGGGGVAWRVVHLSAPFRGRDVWLSHLHRCVVAVLCPLVACRINDVSDSVVLLGPIAGSAHVERCRRTFVAVACRQLRIHHARGVYFSLATKSNPIIEHSSLVDFAPYTVAYPGVEADVAHAELAAPLAGGDPRGAGSAAEAGESGGSWSQQELDGDELWGGASAADEAKMPWARVDDFHWHRVQKSPNWGILPRTRRVRRAVPLYDA